MLIDSHCHLDFPEFADDLDGVVARAAAAGVTEMLTISTELSRFPGVRAVAERFANVWCSVGVHPHEAETDWGLDAERLVAAARHPKVVGIGETGLDYYYEHSPRARQQASFRAHIAAARATGLPLIVHTRDADDDTIAVLEAEMARGPFPGLIHCFSGTERLARAALDLGLSLSFSGIVTFKKAEPLREIAGWVPADRILIETDAPYLAPVPMRGKRCEPAHVAHTAAVVAAARGLSVEALGALTSANFRRLFAKTAAGAAAA